MTPSGPLKKLMTVEAVADVLDVSDRSVWRLLQRGELTAIRVGGNTRIHPDDLQALIERARSTQ